MKMQKCLCALLIFLCAVTSLFSQGDNKEKVLRVANQLPSWNGEEIIVKEMGGGAANENYKVSFGANMYFFRCGNENGAVLGASLKREWQITHLVAAADIAPNIVLYLPDNGILVTDFIQTTKAKVNLRDPLTRQRFCRLISSVHNLAVEFPTHFCPFETIRGYTKSALEAGVALPTELTDLVLPKIDALQSTLPSKISKIKKPSHLDLHGGNVLDDGKKLWLIDWEYAAMSDPFFDLATLTSAEDFSDHEMHELLQCYLSRDPSQEEAYHFYCMRILADTRWALWEYLQSKVSRLDLPYQELGDFFFQRSLERIKKLNGYRPDENNSLLN